MGAGLRTSTAALAIFSIGLCAAVISCASKTISYFNTNQSSNVWLLPIWPNHFDIRELYVLIGTSAAVLVLNCFLLLAIFVSALPANLIVLITTLLSACASIVAIAFTSIINNQAPTRDTIQSWTCRWTDTQIWSGQGPPQQFADVCQQTRVAFYSTIPIFVLQLLLLSIAIFAITTRGNKGGPSVGHYEDEKNTSQHELGPVQHVSFETKSESPQSMRVGGKDAKGVQFA